MIHLEFITKVVKLVSLGKLVKSQQTRIVNSDL